MRLPQLILPSFLSAAIFLFSCSSEPEKDKGLTGQFSGILPALVQNDSNLFHGLALGMSKEQVKKLALETDSLSLEEPDYLLFEGSLGPGQEYTYDCNFDAKGLSDITLDIHLKNEKNAHVLFSDFRKYFGLRYGNPVDSTMIWSWDIKGSRPAILDLQEEEDYGYGKLMISFYDASFEPDSLGGQIDSLFIP